MSTEEVLKANERTALNNNQFIANVNGKDKVEIKSPKKIKSWGAMGFLTIVIAVFAILFSSGNIIPSAISERLIEETDVQYADAVESKKLVFQQALLNGEIPEDTAKILKENGVLVGYYNGNNFVENNRSDTELVLIVNNRTITANNFITEVNSNVDLYDAFNNATYSRAAYYYDESAREVFKKIGTNRDNYSSDSDFDEVMESLIGNGSNIDINSVYLEKKEAENQETGEMEVYYELEQNGDSVSSKNNTEKFISEVMNKNLSTSRLDATINSADTLKVADTISKEQRSSLFFAVFMENISKMKAGKGNESKINEAMNYLYEDAETEVVDVKTGEIIKTYGTPLDSPSLYAILSGDKPNKETAENYSSDRILKTVENKLNLNNSSDTTLNTVASSASNIKGSVGRLINSGNESASPEILNLVTPTVYNSLENNSYKTIKGVNAGEFLVEGAVNLGKELAKASGGAAGDDEAAISYARLNSSILAMDAAVDRKNKSPFDVTSKNTFLGSIFYNLAINLKKIDSSHLSKIKIFAKTTSSALSSLLPFVKAEGENNYLTTFGDCETYKTINVVGSVHCAEIVTFDTSTLNDPFNDRGFIDFIETNTTLSASGSRTINNNSVLSDYILYNNERQTPLGVIDGGILSSINNNSSTIPFMSSILDMIKDFIGATDNDKRIASGATFVNSKANPDWQTYKYAQRYVSLARATAALRQYAGNSDAYNKITYFEGKENPVIAFLRDYHEIANNN